MTSKNDPFYVLGRMPPKKRKMWDNEDMVKAMDGVKEGMSVRGASIESLVCPVRQS